MSSNSLSDLVSIFIVVLVNIFTVSAQTPPIVYVATDNSGDYNCDGTSDQEEINAALDFVADHPEYTSVYLKGPNTYWINEPIYISSYTTLEGDANAVIKLVNHANWNTKYKALIGQKGTTYTFGLADTTVSSTNITIRGFEIDGNREQQSEPSGQSYYTIIQLQSCYNITINDMYLHDNLADAIQTGFPTYGHDINSKFYNLRVHQNGHDAIYVANCENFEIYDNIFTNNRTDAGARMQYCNHFKVYNNIIGNDPDRQFSGGIGVQIQVNGDTPINDVEIFNNFIYGKGAYHCIWLWQINKGGSLNSHRDVHIHHNVLSWSKLSGIGIYGFNNTLIENNVIESNDQDSGITFYEGDPVNNVTGYQTIVKNNIIVNNKSYGLDNRKPNIHSFVSTYNCIYGNDSGSYHNASSNTDIHEEPYFAYQSQYYYDNYGSTIYSILQPVWANAVANNDFRGDLGAYEAWDVYHPRSEKGRWDGTQWVQDDVTSPCIDAGDPMSPYYYEPSPNGDRMNLGVFGNTVEASKGLTGTIDISHIVDKVGFYPTTVGDTLKIKGKNNIMAIQIVSLEGQLLLETNILSGDNSISLAAIPDGIFMFGVETAMGWEWYKIVKLT